MKELDAQKMNTIGQAFCELVKVIARLRDPNGGCPWDLEQTHATLTQYAIEEAYEVGDAVEKLDGSPQAYQKLAEELGDLLLQSVLHAQIASEASHFDIEQVVRGLSEKLVKRHPHVFGETKVSGSQEVLSNWEQSKQKDLNKNESILDGVPKAMPALLRAQRLGDKAARVGFDWASSEAVIEKIVEEVRELEQASPNDSKSQQEELGDLLFSLVQWARKSKITLEETLQRANEKFATRFKKMEALTAEPLDKLDPQSLDTLWQQAKRT